MTTVATQAAQAARTDGTARAVRIHEFRLPDLGEGLTESEILQWHVREGDTVELNQVIADVETAKAVVELPSPCAGVVVRLHEAAGTTVRVGAPIISFEVSAPSDDAVPPGSRGRASGIPSSTDHEHDGNAPDQEHSRDGEDPPARREPNLVGYGAALEAGGRPQRRRRSLPPFSGVGTPHAADRPRSTPPVRTLARDLGISLDGLTGTGVDALITREDVLAARARADGPSPAGGSDMAAPSLLPPLTPTSSPLSSRGGITRTPIRGVRKLTAAAMVASAFTAPHVTEFLSVDVTPTMELLAALRAGRAFENTKVTPLTIVAKAVCLAVRRNPSVNSSWDERAQEIVQFQDVNLGIAAATPRGLLVPNIKSAQSLQLADLARALASLTDAARAGRTPPADLAGGTISITNIGVFGIDAGTPILNPGEAAILAVGAVRRMPWEYRDAVALRSVMTLSLSIDHRLVDGEQGSRFLADVGTILSNPAMVLTMV